MTIGEILAEVNLACDEGGINFGAHLDSTLARSQMSLILSCARNALRWLAQNAPLWMLDGTDVENVYPGMLADLSALTLSGNTLEMPSDFIRLRRLRMEDWHRSVTIAIDENSEDYLMLSDLTATASNDRPVVALVYGNPCKLELYPAEGNISGSYVRYPVESLERLSQSPLSIDLEVPIPPKMRIAFVYFTAYLMKMSYGDPSVDKWRDMALSLLVPGVKK